MGCEHCRQRNIHLQAAGGRIQRYEADAVDKVIEYRENRTCVSNIIKNTPNPEVSGLRVPQRNSCPELRVPQSILSKRD